ncbi:MAG: MBL fold metallo-hydrolase [Candidatus Lokiarchaeota archaeon]|nr:MBL fold metallo-hydrolase [Candidatus Lokiarchaeota archaeon]
MTLNSKNNEISRLKIKFVVENTIYRSKLMAEHGLSVYIYGNLKNGEKFNILFDTGQTGEVLMNNIRQMKIDVNNLDCVVLSHGHYDHTGGLKDLLTCINGSIPIYCHPNAFEKKYSVKQGEKREIGMPYGLPELQELGGVFHTNKEPIKIIDKFGDIFITTGEVERKKQYEKVPERFKKLENSKLVYDNIIDDLSLIIDTPEGIILLTGCCHSGIVNTTNYALKISNSNRILGTFGGFHLMSANRNKINNTIRDLKKHFIQLIGGCHCTGLYAIHYLLKEFPDNYRACSTGIELFYEF